jgi:hypothetical protein
LALAAALAVAFGGAPAQSAEVFRWVDEQGRVQYGDTPPRGAQRLEVPLPSPEETRQARERLEAMADSLRGARVFGAFEVRIVPKYGAPLPVGAVVLALTLEPVRGEPAKAISAGEVSTNWRIDADGSSIARIEFETSLRAGAYRPIVEVSSSSLGRKTFVLRSTSVLIAPERGCIYRGLTRDTWVRLPRASLDRSARMASRLADESGVSAVFTYYSVDGMLVYGGARASGPDAADPSAVSELDRALQERAKAAGCVVIVP